MFRAGRKLVVSYVSYPCDFQTYSSETAKCAGDLSARSCRQEAASKMAKMSGSGSVIFFFSPDITVIALHRLTQLGTDDGAPGEQNPPCTELSTRLSAMKVSFGFFDPCRPPPPAPRLSLTAYPTTCLIPKPRQSSRRQHGYAEGKNNLVCFIAIGNIIAVLDNENAARFCSLRIYL